MNLVLTDKMWTQSCYSFFSKGRVVRRKACFIHKWRFIYTTGTLLSSDQAIGSTNPIYQEDLSRRRQYAIATISHGVPNNLSLRFSTSGAHYRHYICRLYFAAHHWISKCGVYLILGIIVNRYNDIIRR